MKKEKEIKTLKDTIKGLNDLTIKLGNDKEMVEKFNKATDILERELARLLNKEQKDERSVATKMP